MRLLLDSHILIWSMLDDPRLTPATRVAMRDADAVLVSAASFWEISIKQAKGRLEVPDDLPDRADLAGFDTLSVTTQHGWIAGSLPRIHMDPFDRVLIAQAIVEGLTIVTTDRRIREYGVPVIAA